MALSSHFLQSLQFTIPASPFTLLVEKRIVFDCGSSPFPFIFYFIGMSESSLRSVPVQPEKLRLLRQSLGWTQEVASRKSGYSARLIRKIESGGRVRPETLVDVLQCYHVASNIEHWSVSDFLSHELLPGETPLESLRQDQHRQILRMQEWYVTAYAQREIDRVAEFIDPAMTYQHAEGPVHVGVEAIRKMVAALLTGFDPMTFEFPHSFFSDGYVHTFWKLKMKHVGEFSGVPASGRWVTVRGNSRVKLVGDKMVDAEDNWDVYDVIRQLKGESRTWL